VRLLVTGSKSVPGNSRIRDRNDNQSVVKSGSRLGASRTTQNIPFYCITALTCGRRGDSFKDVGLDVMIILKCGLEVVDWVNLDASGYLWRAVVKTIVNIRIE
jgi:hypothetical protein